MEHNKIMDCRELATLVKDQVKEYVDDIKNNGIPVPKLVCIQVGKMGASSLYVGNKKKACEYCGAQFEVFNLNEETTTTETLIHLIQYLNNDQTVHGIFVQYPLPEHIDPNVVQFISPLKDVDCFTAINVGAISIDMTKTSMIPCTVGGIYQLLRSTVGDIAGKHCVVIGRSNIVGKPMASVLTQMDATVTLCHSKTKNLASHLLNADIIISAVGKPKFINHYMVKEGAIIIDVGINKDENGKTCGDVEVTDELLEKVEWVTPVPRGVGQLTVSTLMSNLIRAHANQMYDYYNLTNQQVQEESYEETSQPDDVEEVQVEVIPPSDQLIKEDEVIDFPQDGEIIVEGKENGDVVVDSIEDDTIHLKIRDIDNSANDENISVTELKERY